MLIYENVHEILIAAAALWPKRKSKFAGNQFFCSKILDSNFLIRIVFSCVNTLSTFIYITSPLNIIINVRFYFEVSKHSYIFDNTTKFRI